MRDLKDPRLIYLKGLLFLLGAVMAAAGLFLQTPTLRTAFLTAVAVWCAARFYYFAFYVLERYVDPSYRFAGLIPAARFVLTRPLPSPPQRPEKAGPFSHVEDDHAQHGGSCTSPR